MIASQRLLTQLDLLVRKTGATSASVYLPTPWDARAPAVLVHAGADPPLRELATADAAAAFTGAVLESGEWEGTPVALDALIPSASGDGYLMAVPLLTSLWAGGVTRDAGAQSHPQRRSEDQRQVSPVAGWIGLRLPTPPPASEVTTCAHALASTIVSVYSVLTDPLTGLPGRHELQGVLRADLDRARRRRVPCSLLLVNPIGLDSVNEGHGRPAGDGVIREFVQAMHGLLRRSDVLMRYGGAIFALPLGNIGTDSAVLVAERVRRHVAGHAFLQGTVHLRCAVGVVSTAADDAELLDPLDLLRRANEALGIARQGGGEAIVVWRDEGGAKTGPPTDRLLGIFTGRTDKDYRNMGLLWDVLQALSGATGSADLAEKVVDRLFSVLHPTRAALFLSNDSGVRLLFGQQRLDDGADPRLLQAGDIAESERAIVAAAVQSGAVRQQTTTVGGRPQLMLALPLVTDGRTLGAVCLVGNPAVIDIDRNDLHVLTGVATQLAVALDREQLAELHRVRAEHERRRLQAELHDLRSQQSPIVFQSAAMTDLLVRARRVAATDTTVLVTGESGTGKEMLAQTLHQLGGRRAKPFVIVDCGAIPATLIDSELFGHERGAFTGAQQRSSGRLAMADGGTVFLDEIGELPLDVQSRLLRFVQEKTISMVGGTRARKVDVRIIAATNRRLEDEVRTGRFREDLFYRLNVVRLHIPPLRDRPEDVRLLAEHFARASSAEQRKPLLGFSPEAERRLLGHTWPGNIRELQNTILQAVVLSEGDCLEATDLHLPEAGADGPFELRPPDPAGREIPSPAPRRPVEGAVPFDVAWPALRDRIAAEVQAAASAQPRLALPLGRWVAHELVLVAHEQADGVGARAAARIGLPQTTFARRLRQAEADRALSTRPATWVALREALAEVVGAAGLPAGVVADRLDALVLDVVLAAVPAPLAYAATLMGLSTPTMKTRLASRTTAAVA